MKKRKTNQLKLWAIGVLTILLLAASSAWAEFIECYPEGSPYNLDADDIDGLNIWPDAIVNLYTTYVPYVFVAPGGILNIYSGSIGLLAINTANPDAGETDAVVTVYGTDFKADWQCDNTIVSLDGETEFTPDINTGSILIATDQNGNSMNMLCFSDTAINLVDIKKNEETIEIDIKPGCDKNVINLKSKGVVPVALLSEGDFKAGDIFPDSVVFAGAKPVRSTLCDVDCDGDMDMLFHFRIRNLVDLNEDSTEAELKFTSTGEKLITVTDSVKIIPFSEKKKNKHLSDSKNKKKDNHVWDKKHKFAKKNTPKHKRPGRGHKGR